MHRIPSFFLLILLFSCSNDTTNRNPFLQEFGFRFDMNLNLPLYSPLTNTGNAIYIPNQGVGIRGVFVMNVGFDQFRAFEATDPNHAPNSCSTMEMDGQKAVCPCEGYEYSLFTGQQFNRPNDGQKRFDMLEYRVSFSGNVVSVFN